MVTHCYMAHAYCDNPDCIADYGRHHPDEVTGKNYAACKRELKAMGWYVGRGVECCPVCTAKGVQWALKTIRLKGKATQVGA